MFCVGRGHERNARVLQEISDSGLWIQLLRLLECEDLWELSLSCRFFHELLTTSEETWGHLLLARYGVEKPSSAFGRLPSRSDYARLTARRQHAHISMIIGCGVWRKEMGGGGESLNSMYLVRAPRWEVSFRFRCRQPGVYRVLWRVKTFGSYFEEEPETLPFYIKTLRRPLALNVCPEEVAERRVRYKQTATDEETLYRYDWRTPREPQIWSVIELPARVVLFQEDDLETGLLDFSLVENVWGHHVDWVEIQLLENATTGSDQTETVGNISIHVSKLA